jgi:hypothetical protein
MMDDMRRYLRAGLDALSSQGANDLPSGLRERAQSATAQLSMLAAGFLQWGSEAKESLFREIREIVAHQIQEMGVPTRQDLETLRSRLDRLESMVTGLEPGTGSGDAGSPAPSSGTAVPRTSRARSSGSGTTVPRTTRAKSRGSGNAGSKTGSSKKVGAGPRRRPPGQTG